MLQEHRELHQHLQVKLVVRPLEDLGQHVVAAPVLRGRPVAQILHEQALDRHVDAVGEQPGAHAPAVAAVQPHDRGLHSSTFQLNLSLFCHILTDATQRIST